MTVIFLKARKEGVNRNHLHFLTSHTHGYEDILVKEKHLLSIHKSRLQLIFGPDNDKNH